MRSIFFTKPKDLTFRMLKYMHSHKDDVGVVLYDKGRYCGSDFVRFCNDNNVSVYDYDECDGLFDSLADLDVIWCNTFPKRIKEEWLGKARIAAINFHAAPLPEYRGVFGFNFALLNGAKEFGVTAHLLDKDFDTGEIVEVSKFQFDPQSANVASLVEMANDQIYSLFTKTHERLKDQGFVESYPQNLSEGRYYSREDFEAAKKILPEDDKDTIARKIKAFWFPPYEGAYMEKDGERFYPVTKEILDELGKQ